MEEKFEDVTIILDNQCEMNFNVNLEDHHNEVDFENLTMETIEICETKINDEKTLVDFDKDRDLKQERMQEGFSVDEYGYKMNNLEEEKKDVDDLEEDHDSFSIETEECSIVEQKELEEISNDAVLDENLEEIVVEYSIVN